MNNQLLQTPIGWLNIVTDASAVVAIKFDADPAASEAPNAVSQHCCQQLEAYFDGELRDFDVPLKMQGTDFQCQVWQALNHVPYGETCSYADIANRIGNPKAVRAVGAANGKNPVPIIVPCHRVIGSSGKLTGYAGGLDLKIWLLEHESRCE